MNLTHIAEVFHQYCTEFKTLLIDKLETNERKASGNLIKSIDIDAVYDGKYYTATLSALPYMQQIEHFRPPTQGGGDGAVYRNIKKWIQVKNIIPRAENGKKPPTLEQLAYLISRKIHRIGFYGDHSIAKTQAELNRKYIPLLQKALVEDVKEYLKDNNA